MVHQNRSNFRFWLPVQIWNDLWPIILCNLKTKHRRYIKLYIFWILMTRQTIWHYLQRNRSMFQFSTHMELSRSMAAILEMPQYVAYQKNVVYAFIKLSAKSHSFNILCTMDGLSCPTMNALIISMGMSWFSKLFYLAESLKTVTQLVREIYFKRLVVSFSSYKGLKCTRS